MTYWDWLTWLKFIYKCVCESFFFALLYSFFLCDFFLTQIFQFKIVFFLSLINFFLFSIYVFNHLDVTNGWLVVMT